MKKIALTCVIATLLFSSCARYQINMVQSTNVKKDENTGRFVQENDSVRITYSFAGNNAPVAIEVFNKLDKPLIVDWKSSAIVVGDKAISYIPQEVPIKGEFKTDYYLVADLGSLPGNIKAMAKMPVETSFVAPHSAVSNSPLNVADNLSARFSNITTTKEAVPNKLFPNSEAKLSTANFTEAESPLKFRSYLTIRTSDEHPKTMVFEPRFYVAKYVETKNEPVEIDGLAPTRGDVFLLK